jgi:hypothetical protein
LRQTIVFKVVFEMRQAAILRLPPCGEAACLDCPQSLVLL